MSFPVQNAVYPFWQQVIPGKHITKQKGYFSVPSMELLASPTWLGSSYIIAQLNITGITNKFSLPNFIADCVNLAGGPLITCIRYNTGDISAGGQSVVRYRLTTDAEISSIQESYPDFWFPYPYYNKEKLVDFGNQLIFEFWSTPRAYGAGTGSPLISILMTTLLQNKQSLSDEDVFEITSWIKNGYQYDPDLYAATDAFGIKLPLQFSLASLGL
jgi:hypothetical protein